MSCQERVEQLKEQLRKETARADRLDVKLRGLYVTCLQRSVSRAKNATSAGVSPTESVAELLEMSPS